MDLTLFFNNIDSIYKENLKNKECINNTIQLNSYEKYFNNFWMNRVYSLQNITSSDFNEKSVKSDELKINRNLIRNTNIIFRNDNLEPNYSDYDDYDYDYDYDESESDEYSLYDYDEYQSMNFDSDDD